MKSDKKRSKIPESEREKRQIRTRNYWRVREEEARKYGVDPTDKCPYCLDAFFREDGVISDDELADARERRKEKRKKKEFGGIVNQPL